MNHSVAPSVIVFDYFGVLARQYGSPDEQLIELIAHELHGHYTVAILSNMNRATPEEMLGEHAGLFDEVMISGELGVAKPDKRAFLLAANRLKEFPEQMVLIDDSEVNCAVAAELGMTAIHYKNIAQLRQELAKYGILTP